MKETSIHTLLQANWKEQRVLLERVESAVNTGTADCNACYDGHEWWMEYKAVGHKAKTTTIKVSTSLGDIWMRPAQFAWHVNRANYGSKAFVVGRTDRSLVVMRCHADGLWEEVFTTTKPFDYKGLLGKFVSE